ncbi:MAG: hypothetical protein LBP30_09000, partial [Clostridiales Family XIII bacterium]|nr:hypothetical protein [Clostridiales Family XIII bacterium]
MPDSTYPSEVAEYLQWDDDKVIAKIKERVSVFPPAKRFMDRRVKSCVYETTAHSGGGTDDQVFGIIKRMLKEKLGYEPDCDAANKLAHKIPVLEWYDMDSGRGVPILTGYS